MNNLLLLENNLSRRRIWRHGQRKEWLNAIHVKREELGEFHHIKDPKRFYGYLRMTRDTFDYILSEVRRDLTKCNNFRKTISPEEGVVVTLSSRPNVSLIPLQFFFRSSTETNDSLCFTYLTTGPSFKTLGYSYRVADNTICNIIHDTYKVLGASSRHAYEVSN
ncbi:hypothetical protein PR048_027683 [Dryococelus australis]|uniref:Uncharacterized protein n=1 Tax=Dryococelus australis TaxID=614101 RepID=A0ABQ9GH59_9NEOP|nr:hypothetical protein PR048_027683 [Dryococelus australis]